MLVELPKNERPVFRRSIKSLPKPSSALKASSQVIVCEETMPGHDSDTAIRSSSAMSGVVGALVRGEELVDKSGENSMEGTADGSLSGVRRSALSTASAITKESNRTDQ